MKYRDLIQRSTYNLESSEYQRFFEQFEELSKLGKGEKEKAFVALALRNQSLFQPKHKHHLKAA